jgi:hypothetical protein
MDQAWPRIDAEARAAKDSRYALIGLDALYRSIAPADRPEANRAIVAWLEADDPRRRFDALALIEGFGIVEASPALDRLVERHRAAADAFHQHERDRAQEVRASLQDG